MKVLLESLNSLFDIITFGSSPGARYWFIVLVSLISAVVFLYLFKLVSNQQRIRLYKNRIWGNILQMRIYQDRLRVIFSSILKVAGYNLLYLKEMLIPLLVLLPPLFVFTVQVNNRCGYETLATGDKVAVKVVLAEESSIVDFESLQGVTLRTEGGLEVQTPALRIPDEAAVYWRLGAHEATAPNALSVTIEDSRNEQSREIALKGNGLKRFGPVLAQWSWSSGLLHNAEGFLPDDSPFESIRIDYARQQYPLLWWDTDCLVVYFVLVLVFALVLKPFFRVAL